MRLKKPIAERVRDQDIAAGRVVPAPPPAKPAPAVEEPLQPAAIVHRRGLTSGGGTGTHSGEYMPGFGEETGDPHQFDGCNRFGMRGFGH